MQTPDPQKLLFNTTLPAFKNNNVYTGSFNITGTSVSGTNTRTFEIQLDETPDILDIMFQGQGDLSYGVTGNPRPDNAYFKDDYITVRADDPGAGYVNYPTAWYLTSAIVGNKVIVTATYIHTFTANLTFTSTTVHYKIVDYSVF